MNFKYSITLVTALVVMLLVGMPVLASRIDGNIESSAKKSYVFKNYLNSDDVNVKSKDGVVTLTGSVDDENQKSLAEDTVADLRNVKSVDNKLEVKGDQPSRQSDAWMTTKVKTTLLLHSNVSVLTEVSAQDGIITLQGKADNQAEKDLTTEYARDIGGVKGVKNEMVISGKTIKKASTSEMIDDASITAQVKMALLSHSSTSAVNTKVSTKNGVVTLRGKARNAAEIDLVTKYVRDIRGVKEVNNKMTGV